MPQIEGGLGPYQNAGAPVNGTNEVQTITPSAAVASGTWKLKFDGFTTASLAWNISAAALKTALELLPNIGAGGLTVALDGGTGVYTITFSGANVAIRVQNLITVVESALLDAGLAAVTMTPAESVAGVSATALGAAAGATLVDTTNKIIYVNMGTAAAPTWTKILAGITLTAAIVNAMISGVAAGYKVARGIHTMLSASETVVTGLATVVSVVAAMESDPILTFDRVTASIGNQAGAPAAGSVYVKGWMPTDLTLTTPIAATGFAGIKVNWIAIGT